MEKPVSQVLIHWALEVGQLGWKIHMPRPIHTRQNGCVQPIND
jgi:hypothetical protein